MLGPFLGFVFGLVILAQIYSYRYYEPIAKKYIPLWDYGIIYFLGWSSIDAAILLATAGTYEQCGDIIYFLQTFVFLLILFTFVLSSIFGLGYLLNKIEESGVKVIPESVTNKLFSSASGITLLLVTTTLVFSLFATIPNNCEEEVKVQPVEDLDTDL